MSVSTLFCANSGLTNGKNVVVSPGMIAVLVVSAGAVALLYVKVTEAFARSVTALVTSPRTASVIPDAVVLHDAASSINFEPLCAA